MTDTKYLEKIHKERIEKIKRLTKTVDANDMLKTMITEIPKLPIETRKQIADALEKVSINVAEMLIERALIEGDMTESQFKYLKDEKGMATMDFEAILSAYFDKKDNPRTQDKHYVITHEGSATHNNRDYLKQMFGVCIKTFKELNNTPVFNRREGCR